MLGTMPKVRWAEMKLNEIGYLMVMIIAALGIIAIIVAGIISGLK